MALLLKEKFDNEIEIINDDILKISEDKISNQKLVVFGNLPFRLNKIQGSSIGVLKMNESISFFVTLRKINTQLL